jgi:hypothetical protein
MTTLSTLRAVPHAGSIMHATYQASNTTYYERHPNHELFRRSHALHPWRSATGQYEYVPRGRCGYVRLFFNIS